MLDIHVMGCYFFSWTVSRSPVLTSASFGLLWGLHCGPRGVLEI